MTRIIRVGLLKLSFICVALYVSTMYGMLICTDWHFPIFMGWLLLLGVGYLAFVGLYWGVREWAEEIAEERKKGDSGNDGTNSINSTGNL